MLEFTVRHPLLCAVDRYWRLFLSPEFSREMMLGLGFSRIEIGPLVRDPKRPRQQTRSMKVTPKLDLPGPVVRAIGDRLSYEEHGTYDEDARRWTFRERMSVLPERILIGGSIRVEASPSGRCRRVSDLWVDVKIFGVGGLIERAAEANLRDGFRRSALWFNRWLAAHPERE